MNTKKRQSNLELLRILSIFIIVLSHCDDIFGLAELYSSSLGIYKVITDLLHIGGQIGVGCFLLISGYFMIEKTISAAKIMKIAGEVWFYTIGIWILWFFLCVLPGQVGIKELIKETIFSFFPLLFCHYWFATTYILLMIFSPFINKLLIAMSKQEYQLFLCCLIVVFVVLGGGIPFAFPELFEGRLIPVIIMYVIGGYIRRFGKLEKSRTTRRLTVILLSYTLLFISTYFLTYLGITFNNEEILEKRYFYKALNSPLVVIICVELFHCFLRLDIKSSEAINVLANSSMGVYLLHKNRILFRYLKLLFPFYKIQNPAQLFMCSLVTGVLIYGVCAGIDCVRRISVEKIWMNFVQKNIKIKKDSISCYFMKQLDKFYEW